MAIEVTEDDCEIIWWWSIGLTAVFFLVVVFIAGAYAHEWYPRECCTDHDDCRPVACSTIEREGQIWIYTPSRNRFTKSNASPDGACHVCIGKNGASQCLFMPNVGM